MSGYLRPSILWHLHHSGAANSATLARLIGRPSEYVKKVLRTMRASGQLAESPSCPGLLELTVKGIAAARGVDITQVETAPEAEAPAVVQPPRFDRLRAPLYVPETCHAQRPGSQDFKRLVSRGQRC